MALGIMNFVFSLILFLLIGFKFPEIEGAPEPKPNQPVPGLIRPPCTPCPDGFGSRPPSTGLAPTVQIYCPPCTIVNQSCSRGYYLEGNQCIQCPCRVPGSYCRKEASGVVCICPEGYAGFRCEICAPGYVQQSYYPYACAKPNPGIPSGCIDGPSYPWPNCTVAPPWPGTPCPPCPFQPNCPPCPWQPAQPTCPPCVFNPVVGPDYCPPCRPPPQPPIPPPTPPPQCPYPPCQPFPPPTPPITFRPIPECPVTPICPRPPPPPLPPPCPLPLVCPVQVPPTVSCPYMPVCPIPVPTSQPQPCPVMPICPIPIPECNVTCDCNCPGIPTTPGGPDIFVCPSACPPCHCDPRGTLVQDGKECHCKKNVEGALCDTCKPGYFGLRTSNSRGCLKCFCSGVSDSCSFAPFYKGMGVCTVTSDVQLVDSDGNSQTLNRGSPPSYTFPGTGRGSPLLYWVLPRKTFDNKDLCSGSMLKSYGMVLSVGLGFQLASSTGTVPGNDIIIVGTDHFTIYWTSRESFPVGDLALRAVLDENDGWLVAENNRSRLATRADILFVLANVDKILLRATFAGDNMRSTTLRSVTLEQGTLATPRPSDFSLQIEDCACPIGYTGHSCESCAPNFYRAIKDMSHSVFGACKRCPCRDPNARCSLDADGNVKCSDCEVEDSLSVSLKPLRVNCCENTEIEFTCSYTSTKRLEIEFYTIPPTLQQFRRKESSNGVTATIRLTSRLQKVVCVLKDDVEGNRVVVVEASSFINVRNCNVTVQSPPPLVYVNATIVPDGKFRCYNVGETIHFNCSAWFFPGKLPLLWSRPGGKIIRRDPYARPQSSGEVIIRNAEESDSGTYFCSVSHPTAVQLDRVVILVYNKTVGICPRCRELPIPFREQDDAPMMPGWTQQLVRDEQHFAMLEYLNTSSLTLSTLTTTAAPKLGLAPNVTIEPSIMHANVGDMVQFICNILEGTRDNITVFWRKKDGTSDVELGVTNSTTLTFGPIAKKHAGEYHCIVTNTFGKGGDKAELIVHEKDPESPKLELFPEKPLQADEDDIGVIITVKPPGHLVKPGGKVELHCQAKADENLKIEWLKENGIIRKTANIESNGQLLVLPSVAPDDSGWYICSGTSAAGDVVSAKTKLVVKAESVAPTVSISEPSPLLVKGGSRIRLECQAYGEPIPVLSWSRFVNTPDGMQETVLLETQANSIVFEIRHAIKAHEGEYFCTGKNDGGQDRVSMLLKVNDGIQCTQHQYRCHSGDQCIALDDKCDGERDCRDGSDERHCHHHHHSH